MVNRRQALAGLAGAAAGAAMIAAPRLVAANAGDKPAWPWTPHKLAPRVRPPGLRGLLRPRHGLRPRPFVGLLIPWPRSMVPPTPPSHRAALLAGGTAGWGTLCGSLTRRRRLLRPLLALQARCPGDRLYPGRDRRAARLPAGPATGVPKPTSVSHPPVTPAGRWCRPPARHAPQERAERCAGWRPGGPPAALIVPARRRPAIAVRPARVQGAPRSRPGRRRPPSRAEDCPALPRGRLTPPFPDHP